MSTIELVIKDADGELIHTALTRYVLEQLHLMLALEEATTAREVREIEIAVEDCYLEHLTRAAQAFIQTKIHAGGLKQTQADLS